MTHDSWQSFAAGLLPGQIAAAKTKITQTRHAKDSALEWWLWLESMNTNELAWAKRPVLYEQVRFWINQKFPDVHVSYLIVYSCDIVEPDLVKRGLTGPS